MQSNAHQCKSMQINANQGKAMERKKRVVDGWLGRTTRQQYDWLCKSTQINANQCKAMQSNAKRCKAMQSDAKQCKAMQSNAKQSRAMQRNAKQNKAMQNNATIFCVAPRNCSPTKISQKTLFGVHAQVSLFILFLFVFHMFYMIFKCVNWNSVILDAKSINWEDSVYSLR